MRYPPVPVITFILIQSWFTTVLVVEKIRNSSSWKEILLIEIISLSVTVLFMVFYLINPLNNGE
jgi:uncharacterized protein (DUF486 family)